MTETVVNCYCDLLCNNFPICVVAVSSRAACRIENSVLITSGQFLDNLNKYLSTFSHLSFYAINRLLRKNRKSS